MSSTFHLVPITPDLAPLYKQVRLAALLDSPAAFCATYARESQLTDADWLQRSLSLDGKDRIGFLALSDANSPIGLVGCFRNSNDSTQANVISMWVEGNHRGAGVSTALLEAIMQWARSRDFAELRLFVISNNARAIAFYERYGFRKTGQAHPHGDDSVLFEVEMALPLATNSL